MHELIHITVRLLGPAVDMAGQETLEYALTPPATLGDLLSLLYVKYPRLAAHAAALRFAVNDEYATVDQELKDRDEVAVLPPVAGGDHDLVRLTPEPIEVEGVRALVAAPGCGAIVVFEGVVRPEASQRGELVALEYSGYEAMAGKQMERLRVEAVERFALGRAVVVQRIGRVSVGEVAAVIGTAAPRRKAAFDACHWLIEQLKADVPIWKQEIWSDGGRTWARNRKKP